jgi:hypothetical protein
VNSEVAIIFEDVLSDVSDSRFDVLTDSVVDEVEMPSELDSTVVDVFVVSSVDISDISVTCSELVLESSVLISDDAKIDESIDSWSTVDELVVVSVYVAYSVVPSVDK